LPFFVIDGLLPIISCGRTVFDFASLSNYLKLEEAPNDLAVLRWAGRGVAMANAHPEVLEAVALVAPSNQDDGVARMLERLLDGAELPRRASLT
jgi:hypothetical protein